MAVVPTHLPMPELLLRLQTTLRMNQKELANLLGLSSRTIIRYYQRGGTLLPSSYATLAKALAPRDPALATYCARLSGLTLEQLGIAAAPTLPAPASSAVAGARPAPSAAHLADSVVCAGAEAMQCTPTQMRPGLAAALERMIALGMNAEQMLEAVSPPEKAVKTDKPAKSGKTK
jgi:hypothetical protein